jgi:hypothetical protein
MTQDQHDSTAAAQAHDEPHMVNDSCDCECPVCMTPDGGACICPECPADLCVDRGGQ